ncbi:MAG: NfeD family protein [Opitutaceae bacterium]
MVLMQKWLPQLLGFCLASVVFGATGGTTVREAPSAVDRSDPTAMGAMAAALDRKDVPIGERIYVIPVREPIGSAVLYIIRRGIKEAIEQKADAVILDMKTPGGALDSTLEIMEAIAKFPGTTITYVNDEAMSAGAFISATTEQIWFAPAGIIGAAAPVSMGGQDVEATMRQKVVSYLKARIRATSEGKPYRGEVISAMIDADYQLKIGDTIIKDKGELLSLTASEAAKMYGDPPQTLLSAGTAKDIGDLIAQRFGPGQRMVTTLDVTWSESLAVWLNAISSILLGLGLLAIYIEFKTPGFGVFGVVGIVCLAIVFLSSYVAGLSGHEPMLVFGLGLVLLAIEIFFFPGAIIFALTGLVLMLGSLVWAMADLWPNEPLSVAWSGDAFVGPLSNLGLGLVIAVALGIALARFVPRGWFWDKMVVQSTIGGAAQMAGGGVETGSAVAGLVGREGVAATSLHPGGQVEIDGRRYEGRVEIGAVERGKPVIVRGYSDFGLIVEERK